MASLLLKRIFPLAILAAFLIGGGLAVAQENKPNSLAELEAASGGRLGVFALDAATGKSVAYRSEERFPFCSTFKLLLAGAVLERSQSEKGLLTRRLNYAKSDLISWSPITEKHLEGGLTVAELGAATVQYSDNTAANLLLKLVGGPEGLTAFARSLGDQTFRLDRWEPELNTAIPGDERDTTSPAAMARSVQSLVLGEALAEPQRAELQNWLKGNTTGAARIRAGVPEGWIVGDKTGSGAYGATNDIGVLWPPKGGGPVVLAIYFTQNEEKAKARDEVVASATRLVLEELFPAKESRQ